MSQTVLSGFILIDHCLRIALQIVGRGKKAALTPTGYPPGINVT